MKRQLKLLLVLVVLGVSMTGVMLAAPPVVLTVTPSVVSNTYAGAITLDITGLTNTEKVEIRKWFDGNANGAVDPGEWLIDDFKISDGGAIVIGGVTNVSVPYDSSPTSGEITTILTIPPEMPLENTVGHYVYQVVSPAGRFSPVSASFTITNASLSQSVSGVIYSNGVPAPYGTIVAQNLLANNTAGGAIADASGHYSLALAPGTYGFIAAVPGCYFDQNTAPVVVLTNGANATADVYTTNGTVTISGNIYDSTSSKGVAGLLLQVQSGSFFVPTFTDTNGNYSASVTPDFWKVKPTKERLSRRAYVISDNSLQVDATAGNVTGANVAVFRGDALFYGRVTDNSGRPIANAEIDGSANDTNMQNLFSCKGYSDTNGYYGVAVLGDLTNQWSCSINSGLGTPLVNYVLNYFPSITNAPNQLNLDNFVAVPVIGRISGHVMDNSNNPVTGVSLIADNGNNYQSLDGNTDNSGNYVLSVAAGQWNVQFVTGSDNSSLDQLGYADITGPHIVSVPPTNIVLNITVYPVGTPAMSTPRRVSSTQFGFNIVGALNVSYTLQVTTNLGSTNWLSVYSFQLTTNPFPIVDPSATNGTRFYRVLKN